MIYINFGMILRKLASSNAVRLGLVSKLNMKVKNDHRSKFSNLSNWK